MESEYRGFQAFHQSRYEGLVCEPLGLDPQTTTLFEFLEADDRKSFGG